MWRTGSGKQRNAAGRRFDNALEADFAVVGLYLGEQVADFAEFNFCFYHIYFPFIFMSFCCYNARQWKTSRGLTNFNANF